MQALPSFQFTDSVVAGQQLVYETVRQIPGTVQYSIRRFTRPSDWIGEDMGMMRYHVEPPLKENNHLELRFCLSGNMYCKETEQDCARCSLHGKTACREQVASIDVLHFVFSASLLSQFITSREAKSLSEDILTFNHTTSFSKSLPLCNRTKVVLEGLLNNDYTDTLQNIYVNAQTQMLLLYSLNCLLGEKEINTLSCKFLANGEDREKVVRARAILIEHIGEPITIKELSRKVAINECYLKKGFKELFGTTIFEFYQSQRMEHAKYLLYEKGLSVTDVSVLLGYSSYFAFFYRFQEAYGFEAMRVAVESLED